MINFRKCVAYQCLPMADSLQIVVQLCDLYNNDSIFDKFECCLSGDGLHFATGSYRFSYYLIFHVFSHLIFSDAVVKGLWLLLTYLSSNDTNRLYFDSAISYVSSLMVLEVKRGVQ